MLGEVFWGILLILILVFFSGVAVDIFEKIAHEVKINKLLLATFLVSFSTSLPEFSVGIASALKGEPQIALGNLIGANLANLSWIVGGAAVVAGTIPVVGDYLRRDLWMAMGMSMLPFLLMVDGRLSRLDGLLLVIAYMFYAKSMVAEADILKHSRLKRHKIVKTKIKSVSSWIGHVLLLLFVLVSMAVASHYLIDVALGLSKNFGVNAYWVGLLVVSFGTTLPELTLSIFASEKRDTSLLLGNILGSVIVNSTFILGIVGMISPIAFESSVGKGLSGLFLILILGLFWVFTKSKRKLERWEGLTLIGVYMMFVGLQFLLGKY